MKITPTSSLFPQAARLVLISCTTLAASLFSIGTTAAQSANNNFGGNTAISNAVIGDIANKNSLLISGSASTWDNSSITYTVDNNFNKTISNNLISTGSTFQIGTTNQTLYYQIPTNGDYLIVEGLLVETSLTINSLSFNATSVLILDGTLTAKSISCDAPNAHMILCPNTLVDLEGSTLTVSSLTRADGTKASDGIYNFSDDGNLYPISADRLHYLTSLLLPLYRLSNGATLIHGRLIIDSTQPNALHLQESNEHIAGIFPVSVTPDNNDTNGKIVISGGLVLTGGQLTNSPGRCFISDTPTNGGIYIGITPNSGNLVVVGPETSTQQ